MPVLHGCDERVADRNSVAKPCGLAFRKLNTCKLASCRVVRTFAHRTVAPTQERHLHRSTPVNHRLYALTCLKKPKEVFMFQTVSRLLPEVPLILVTAVATHLVMSFSQTLMHYTFRPPSGWAANFSAIISIFITLTIPKIISSHRRTSVKKATTRPSSSSHIFRNKKVRLSFSSAAKSFCGDGNRKCGVVLCACLFRQGISRRGIAASKVCVV